MSKLEAVMHVVLAWVMLIGSFSLPAFVLIREGKTFFDELPEFWVFLAIIIIGSLLLAIFTVSLFSIFWHSYLKLVVSEQLRPKVEACLRRHMQVQLMEPIYSMIRRWIFRSSDHP